MLHDARSVGNELIRRAHEAERDITPMQVLKLVYYCHAWMLGIYGRPLIRQPIEAWRYGPVLPDVYRSLRQCGRDPIPLLIDNVPDEHYDHQERHIIDQVWEQYGPLTGLQLSSLTHAPGTPWHTTWRKWGQNSIIPNTLIERYYRREYERYYRREHEG